MDLKTRSAFDIGNPTRMYNKPMTKKVLSPLWFQCVKRLTSSPVSLPVIVIQSIVIHTIICISTICMGCQKLKFSRCQSAGATFSRCHSQPVLYSVHVTVSSISLHVTRRTSLCTLADTLLSACYQTHISLSTCYQTHISLHITRHTSISLHVTRHTALCMLPDKFDLSACCQTCIPDRHLSACYLTHISLHVSCYQTNLISLHVAKHASLCRLPDTHLSACYLTHISLHVTWHKSLSMLVVTR